jgi:ubiquitin-conjugating enzyme E2 I
LGIGPAEHMAGGEGDVARQRLAQERRDLAKDCPFGCYARPIKLADGSTDVMTWAAGIAPRSGSAYALAPGENYRVQIKFTLSYPSEPPLVSFVPPVFHTNVWADSGLVCLSLLLDAGHHGGTVRSCWSPLLSLKEILLALQSLLDEPNPASVANAEACELLRKSGVSAYTARVKSEAAAYPARLARYMAALAVSPAAAAAAAKL